MKGFDKTTLQLILAVVLSIFGIVLLGLGFYAVPVGEISASVLTAFGEISTFAAALMGIDYTYRFRIQKLESETHKKEKENEE